MSTKAVVIAWLQIGLDALCQPVQEPKAVVWTLAGNQTDLQNAKDHAAGHLDGCHPLVFFSTAENPIEDAKERLSNAYGLDR